MGESPATVLENPLNPSRASAILPATDKTRVLLVAVRQALIMVLGAVEDYLGMERSIVPKHKRIGI